MACWKARSRRRLSEGGLAGLGRHHRSTRRLARAALTALLCAPAAANALHPLITEDAGTQGAGVTQFELTATHERDRDHDTVSHRWDPTLVLTYGLVDAVDAFVSLPFLRLHTEGPGLDTAVNGWSDPALGLKWRFYEQDNLSMAIKPALILPYGDADRGLGKGRTGCSLPFVITRRWEGLAFHTHVAVNGNRNRVGEREHLWHGSLAIERHVSERIKWVLDLGVDRNPDPARNPHPAYLLGGAVYALGRTELSAGIKGKLNSAAPDQALLLGLTWHGK